MSAFFLGIGYVGIAAIALMVVGFLFFTRDGHAGLFILFLGFMILCMMSTCDHIAECGVTMTPCKAEPASPGEGGE
jgi:hypothetical protein